MNCNYLGKRQSPKEKRAFIKRKPADNKQDSNTDALAAHSKNGMVPPSDYDSRDDAFELNQEEKNIDDDDNNNDEINILQADQKILGNLQQTKEALSEKQPQENMLQESIMS